VHLSTKRLALSPSESDAANNCSECGLVDPLGNVNKRRKCRPMLDRVQCNACDLWYHLCCTSLTVLPRHKKSSVCLRCSQSIVL